MPKIDFFLVDPDTFEDIPVGSVTIDGDKITSDNEGLLLDLARSAGNTPEEVVMALTDWSNGYLRSELAGEPLLSSGTEAVVPLTLLSMVNLDPASVDKLPEVLADQEPELTEVEADLEPVPLSLLSMVDLDASAVDEFFNKNHSKNGRFAPGKNSGSGGGGNILAAQAPPKIATPIKDSNNKGPWPKYGGDYPVKKIAEAAEGKRFGLFERRVKVDGFKVKSAYEITGKNGAKIKVYDIDGKEFSPFHKKITTAVADMNGMYPMKPPRSVVMMDRKAFGGAFAWIYPSKPQIFVNQQEMKNLDAGKYGNLEGKGHFMPSFKQKDPSQYLMFHEYGHQHDFSGPTVKKRNDRFVEDNRSYHEANALYKTPDINKHISNYGKSLQVEGYAETFADWHVSKGKTKNPATIAYAQNEGWYGSGTKAIRASGFLEELPEFEPWVFALEEDEPTGDDLKDLFPFDPEEGPIIILYFDRPPEVRGLEPGGGQPTADEVAKAQALIRQVMDDLNGPTVTATGSIQLGTTVSEAHRPVTPVIQLTGAEVPDEPVPAPVPASGSIKLTPSDHGAEEFYNKIHGKDGRFGSGKSGSGGTAAKAPSDSVSQESGKGFFGKGAADAPAEVQTPRGFTTFRDRYAAGEWGKRHYETYAKGVADDLDQSMNTYVWEGTVSDLLRKGGGKPPTKGPGAKIVKDVDQYIAQAPKVPQDVMVYRGMYFNKGSQNPIFKAANDGTLVGKTIRDPGYASTSLERRVAEKYSSERVVGAAAKPKSRLIFEVEVPKGSTAAYVSISKGGGKLSGVGSWITQTEMLMPRNSQLKVRSISEPDSDGIRTVQATLL